MRPYQSGPTCPPTCPLGGWFLLLVTPIGLFAQDHGHARALWEQAIDARGGRKNLHSIRSFHVAIRYQNSFFADVGRREQLVVLPDRRWDWTHSPKSHPRLVGPRLSVFMHDQGRYWAISVNSSKAFEGALKEESSVDIEDLELELFLETSYLVPTLLGARHDKLRVVKYDVVRVSIDNRVYDLFFDTKTHLTRRIERVFDSGKRDSYHELDDYRMVRGVLMPHKVKNSWFPLISDHRQYRLNPDYDRAIFERPPGKEFGPDDWKPKSAAER